MGIIKRADAQVTSDAIAIDLSDIAGQAAELKARAREEAERIVAEARAERDRILAGADERGHGEGYERGHSEGLDQGLAEGRERAFDERLDEIEALTSAWTSAISSFDNLRGELLEGARADLVRLAAEFATRVTKRAVELDAEAVMPQLESLVSMVGTATKLLIRVSPDDERVVREAMPGVVDLVEGSPHVELEVDASLTHGSCELVAGDVTRYDGRVASQIDRLVRAMVPEGAPQPTSDESSADEHEREQAAQPLSDDDDGEHRIGDLAA